MTPTLSKPSWSDLLVDEKHKPYFQAIMHRLRQERAAGKVIYPAQADIFNAIKLTAFDQIKVVILGQDPYHGPNQAHGLSFSVKVGVPFPPSLQNIFKEIQADLGLPYPTQGCLEYWAKQGVLLLNAALSVEAGRPQSHSDWGWYTFTDQIISLINAHQTGVVFLLWGASAQKKAAMIDTQKHYILMAPHPSPLSAHRGFLGCKHFSKTNALLKKVGKTAIDWRLP